MKRFFILFLTAAILPLTLSLALINPIDSPREFFAPNAQAANLVAEVNALRAANNLPPYKTNSILTISAQAHADYMANVGVVKRFSADGLPPHERAIKAGYFVAGDLAQGGSFAENLHSGKDLSPAAVVLVWKDDPVSLKAMLSSDLKDVGAGIAEKNGLIYFVLDVGASTAASGDATPVRFTATPNAAETKSAIVANTPLENGAIYHVVQFNEGLWSIALAYNVTVEQIKKLNSLPSNDIFEGQKLLIRKPEAKTATPTSAITATFGVPTSTATHPVTPTATFTATPAPTPPTSRQSGGMIVGAIVLVALIGAGLGAWLGRSKTSL